MNLRHESFIDEGALSGCTGDAYSKSCSIDFLERVRQEAEYLDNRLAFGLDPYQAYTDGLISTRTRACTHKRSGADDRFRQSPPRLINRLRRSAMRTKPPFVYGTEQKRCLTHCCCRNLYTSSVADGSAQPVRVNFNVVRYSRRAASQFGPCSNTACGAADRHISLAGMHRRKLHFSCWHEETGGYTWTAPSSSGCSPTAVALTSCLRQPDQTRAYLIEARTYIALVVSGVVIREENSYVGII
ncbi:hypothetical protein IWQ55_006643 [Labrenzia sp. EL_208]|nr:hypothetical protein [Labrenzia sp. EL_132]MBG6233401.1 hypothetical protein [Labrenzia sp. EL_208]